MSATGDGSTGQRKRMWPRRVAISCLVIFGPALLIALIGPPLADDEGEGIGLLAVAYFAMTAVVVGVVLVIGYWLVRWLVVWQKFRMAESRSRSISE